MRHLLAGSAHVQGRSISQPRVGPWNLVRQHEVDLRDAGPEAVALQRLCIARWHSVAVDGQQRGGCGVEKHDTRGGFGDLLAARQRAAVCTKVGDERVGDGLTAADGYRPADGMCQRGQHQPRTGGHQRRHLRNRVCGNTGEQRAGVDAIQRPPGRRALLEDPPHHSDGGDRIGRNRTLVAEQQFEHGIVAFNKRAQQMTPRVTVGQLCAGAVDVVVAHGGGPARQRIGIGNLWHLQRDAAGGQIELREKRRRQPQGVDGRTDVVRHPGEFGIGEGAGAAAQGRLRLEHLHRKTGPGADHGGRQAVGSTTDDGDVHLTIQAH